MAKITTLPMLIGIILYYFGLIIVITILTNGKAAATLSSLNSPTAGFNCDFVNNASSCNMNNNIFLTQQKCYGVSSLTYHKIFGANDYFLGCSQFKDPGTCNNFANCNWTPASFLFINTSACDGIVADPFNAGNEKYKVNLSFYGFPPSVDNFTNSSLPDFWYYTSLFGNPSNNFCDGNNVTAFATSQYTCEQFGCNWQNINSSSGTFGQLPQYSTRSVTPVSIWQVMVWIITFQYDFGFNPLFNLIINFIFAVVIPLIIALILYFMFVPF